MDRFCNTYHKLNQIISLERRIPAEEVKISFRWHDAFKKGNASIQSLAFERTSLMFNLAARDDKLQNFW